MFEIDKEILDDEMCVNYLEAIKDEENKEESKRNRRRRGKMGKHLIEGGDCCGATRRDGEEISKPTDVTSGNGCGVR